MFLLFRAMKIDVLGSEDSSSDQADAKIHPRELLGDEHMGQKTCTAPAVFLGNPGSDEPDLAGLLPYMFWILLFPVAFLCNGTEFTYCKFVGFLFEDP